MAKKRNKKKSVKVLQMDKMGELIAMPAKKVHIMGGQCYLGHADIKLAAGILHGGNCRVPKDGFDIYVGFDVHSFKPQFSHYPWNNDAGVVEFVYPIQDGSVPKDVDEFKKLIGYLADALKGGEKVHLGCIGGHGRTGMVIAALGSVLLKGPEAEDAITWMRSVHCEHGVETLQQVNFLNKHFGIKKVLHSYGTPSVSKKKYSNGSGYISDFHLGDDAIGKLETIAHGQLVTSVSIIGDVWGQP